MIDRKQLVAYVVAAAAVAGSGAVLYLSDGPPRSAAEPSVAVSAPPVPRSAGPAGSPPVTPPSPPAGSPRTVTAAPPEQTRGSQPPPRRPPRSPGPPATVGPASGTSLDDLLRQNGPPPVGVAEQLDLFLGGGGDCASYESDTPHIKLPLEVELPSIPVVCFAGFDRARDVRVLVTPPGEAQRVLTFPKYAGEVDGLPLPLTPGDPIGTYHVRAVQGTRVAGTEVEVRRATRPRLWVDPRTAVAGDTIRVHVGGLPPRRPLALHLYTSQTLRYRASFPVTPDANGEGTLAIRTGAATIPDAYAVNAPLIYDPLVPAPGMEPPANSVFWLLAP